jgi:hypothetical protein
MAKLTTADREAIVRTATRLGISPIDLTAVMLYETKGTLNPDIVGGTGNNYKGLIQFGPSERRTYGYKPGMTVAEQVEGPVANYLIDRGVRPGMDLSHIYSVVNAGSLKNGQPRWNRSDGHGTIRSHVARIREQFKATANKIIGRTPPPIPKTPEELAYLNRPPLDAFNDIAKLGDLNPSFPLTLVPPAPFSDQAAMHGFPTGSMETLVPPPRPQGPVMPTGGPVTIPAGALPAAPPSPNFDAASANKEYGSVLDRYAAEGMLGLTGASLPGPLGSGPGPSTVPKTAADADKLAAEIRTIDNILGGNTNRTGTNPRYQAIADNIAAESARIKASVAQPSTMGAPPPFSTEMGNTSTLPVAGGGGSPNVHTYGSREQPAGTGPFIRQSDTLGPGQLPPEVTALGKPDLSQLEAEPSFANKMIAEINALGKQIAGGFVGLPSTAAAAPIQSDAAVTPTLSMPVGLPDHMPGALTPQGLAPMKAGATMPPALPANMPGAQRDYAGMVPLASQAGVVLAPPRYGDTSLDRAAIGPVPLAPLAGDKAAPTAVVPAALSQPAQPPLGPVAGIVSRLLPGGLPLFGNGPPIFGRSLPSNQMPMPGPAGWIQRLLNRGMVGPNYRSLPGWSVGVSGPAYGTRPGNYASGTSPDPMDPHP